MYISNRAFKLIDNILFNSNRFYYEELLFKDKHNIIRIKGILNDSISHNVVRIQNALFLEYFKSIETLNNKKIKNMILILFLLFLLYLKRFYLYRIKTYHN